MTTDPQAERLFAVLKTLLKRKGLRYRDIAAHLDLSLPTVKKFMADCDVDLGRLLAICALIDTSLAQGGPKKFGALRVCLEITCIYRWRSLRHLRRHLRMQVISANTL